MKRFTYLISRCNRIYLAVIIFIFSCTKPILDLGPDFGNTGCFGCNWVFPVTIFINDAGFSPDSVSVKKGTPVTWVNIDSTEHHVVSDNGTHFNSGTMIAGQAYEYTPNAEGSLLYHCIKHGESGEIVITP